MARDRSGRRSMLGAVAYILVPGDRRRRAAGHFGRAAMETAKGVRALSLPVSYRKGADEAGNSGENAGERDRQRIEIE